MAKKKAPSRRRSTPAPEPEHRCRTLVDLLADSGDVIPAGTRCRAEQLDRHRFRLHFPEGSYVRVRPVSSSSLAVRL